MAASWLNGRRWEDENKSKLPTGTVKPGGERSFTGAQLDEILGPDYWRLPAFPPGLDPDGMWRWEQQQKREHRAERVQQAIAKLQEVPA